MKTPKTDKETFTGAGVGKGEYVDASFARSLELQVNELREALEQISRVAVVELGKSRPDLFERATAVLEKTK